MFVIPSRPHWMLFTVMLGTLTLEGCGISAGSRNDPAIFANCPTRGELCYAAIFTNPQPQLVDNRYYGPTEISGPALHEFNGSLSVSAAPRHLHSGIKGTFPDFTVDFITVNGDLVPMVQSIIRANPGKTRNIILSPGRIWAEPGDRGMSRGSFPFTLTMDQVNETKNGVATFLFNHNEVSRIHLQITQETALERQEDIWGIADAVYVPGLVPGRQVAADRHREYLASRMPARDWADHKQSTGAAPLSKFNRRLQQADISQTGLVIDNTVYLQEPVTRHGIYPYPREMRHAAYSITKSAGAALALLRLAQKYGAAVFDLFITDYVNITANHDGWNGVTFGDTLSMATGVGNNTPDPDVLDTFPDEHDIRNPKWIEFFIRLSADEKLSAAFRYGDYPWGAGQVVRYNTTQTFVLAVAMNNFLQQMEGNQANIWDMLVEEVYKPMGLGDVPIMRTIEPGDDPGVPIFGFGLYLNANDVARIAQLLQNDGEFDGQQLLHRDKLRAALRKTAGAELPTSVTVRFGLKRVPVTYYYGFWSFPIRIGDCRATVSYMAGIGGSYIVLLPNGVSAFRFADAFVYDPEALALAASRVRPVCQENK